MENSLDVRHVWTETLSNLADDAAMSAQQRAFVALTVPQNITHDSIELAAPNEFTRDILESHLKPQVIDALERVVHRTMDIRVVVDPSVAQSLDEATTDSLADTYTRDQGRIPARESTDPRSSQNPWPPSNIVDVRDSGRPARNTTSARVDEAHGLNPKYVFETFVIGSSNRFAHAAAVAVSEQPARAYNPLFIYGESGLGKTHLLHAIGHYTRTLYSGARVRYVSSEDFTNQFIDSIQNDGGVAFKRLYRDVDVLLIDDIQFLSEKNATQEEFFHTFNTLHNANKQIVITSDLPPKKLPGFEDRMRSRFEWGLITDVQPPDLETRIAILRKKSAQERIEVRPDVLEFIASKIATNIRELEGALVRVTAFASLNGAPVDVDLAEVVLKDLISDQHGPQVTAPLIQHQSAEYFGVTVADLTGKSRARTLVHARHVAIYLTRELTDLSLPAVAKYFGGRDHTTVMHAERKIQDNLKSDRNLYNQVTEITSRVKAAART